MGLSSKFLPWAQSVIRREPPSQIGLTAGLFNDEQAITLYPQEAPDAPKQGSDIPSRPAWWPIVLWRHDQLSTQEDRFVSILIAPPPHASYPRGRLTPHQLRSNIAVPPHIAYGSLFTQDAPPYGYG